ncbi:hypothetical protein M2480_003051 [Parabacteroides sp. PFB2-12]|uniref:BACON domain-containing protein n=1 Tax=unclassified Parabacteroides TaxID=2649774 RepID=UPI0024747EB9|nr:MULTISPECIES: BACON domain-containing protein [unclassified Parabacteroides]MDH6342781.1 hypothetical protein [Parabacteroides sp. PM6-13]MDH6392045.1 hypothetical protein [Parabacteroides sp. PFB2-12]
MSDLFLKRKGSLLILAALFMFVLTGCVSEDDPPTISVSQSEIFFEQKSDAFDILLTSNAEWKASSNQSWCRPSVSTGRHSLDMKVLVDENNTKFKRTAIITFETQGSNKTITSIIVSQDGIDVWGNGETN